MTVISNNEIAHAFYLVSKDKSKSQQSDLFKNFVKYLYKKRLLSKAGNILSKLEKIINKEEGRVLAKVSIPEKLDKQKKAEILRSLKERYSAKDVVISEILNEKLLGGFKIEVNDEIIDLTVKNKMEKLQEYLTRPV
ncbi:hypothetical protein A2814_00530 [Candidatus Nomurabacteria bacterium RIFCSPHIGHO2_01_FULL_38_19]|uniref:ATP synthase subunit delta n=1 Tax=Candidatus Nomurabacteria bacterium RIFCSPHIGHO2_01_FULL_38_19 TaxID=1801732 RepID=A0A1F6UV81_9BACT|nr:MAG: hypothetical protein A2814_00530 [Candidatus Nomurabacteria bacterium RIFCSPHIGHO2_01_FULL_38_19]